MRLLEAVLEANRRVAAGDAKAAASFTISNADLPLAALTCIDARLNHLLPDALGIPEEQFIWLRNAGNIVTSPLSSTMRSLALACAVKGAKEIAIIGHTDCLVCKTTTLQLLDRLSALGVDRHHLPANLVEYFGLFGSERQNVTRGVDFIRASPLIGSRVPVHGLLIDIKTGKLEWVVNGYDTSAVVVPGKAGELLGQADRALEKLEKIGHFATDELKLPESKIGDFVTTAQDWLHKAEHLAAAVAAKPASTPVPPPAGKPALPPPLKMPPRGKPPR